MNNNVKQGIVCAGFVGIGVWVLLMSTQTESKLDAEEQRQALQQIAFIILVWNVLAVILFYTVKPQLKWNMPPLPMKVP